MLLAVLGLLVALALPVSAPAQGPGRSTPEPYDEYSDSPMVELEGRLYPAVRIFVDGEETDSRGLVRFGRTYLPARETLEKLGGSVRWVQDQRAFYARFPKFNRTVRVTVDSPTVLVYRYDARGSFGAGQQTGTVNLNAPAFIAEGAVFMPVRAAAQAVGAGVDYDPGKRSVRITSPRTAGRR